MKYLSQVKTLSAAELSKKSAELTVQINKLRLEKTVGKNRNVRQSFILRKQRAMLKTLLNQRMQAKV